MKIHFILVSSHIATRPSTATKFLLWFQKLASLALFLSPSAVSQLQPNVQWTCKYVQQLYRMFSLQWAGNMECFPVSLSSAWAWALLITVSELLLWYVFLSRLAVQDVFSSMSQQSRLLIHEPAAQAVSSSMSQQPRLLIHEPAIQAVSSSMSQ